MAFKYTDDEWEALYDKMAHPWKKVICPRCGKELQGGGESGVVQCPTPGCLKDTARGI